MRVLVHDYAGHPFQVQLSRELARRGCEVLHLHCGSLRTAKGAVEGKSDDEPSFRVDAVRLPHEFEKYSPWRRLWQERVYGNRIAARLRDFRADIVLSANSPLVAQRLLLTESQRLGSRFIFWQQDIIGIGIQRVLGRRYHLVGRLIGGRFVALERALLLRSDGIVVISPDFVPVVAALGIPERKIHVIPNWAPIDELPSRPLENDWARAHGLVGRRVLLYSGTLGLKHDPELIVRLAEDLRDERDVEIVVISEGIGADWLRRRRSEDRLEKIRLLPYQPYESLPDVFGSAHVLLAILGVDAGVFSVPSKVLSYLCAGRPLLAAIPGENLAARLIRETGAGLVVHPGDTAGFLAGARRLLVDEALRLDLGHRARGYAEATFDIESIADRFEAVFERAGASYRDTSAIGTEEGH